MGLEFLFSAIQVLGRDAGTRIRNLNFVLCRSFMLSSTRFKTLSLSLTWSCSLVFVSTMCTCLFHGGAQVCTPDAVGSLGSGFQTRLPLARENDKTHLQRDFLW